ncbi:MAG: transposase [Pseudomonadota bacterium]
MSSLFNVSLCAYAVMSNHYHLVVKVDPEGSKTWSDVEVLRRWTSLFKGTLLVQRLLNLEPLSAIEKQAVDTSVRVYRERLNSLSWFMRCLNEPISRRANAEDACTGHFWEARFHSQALCSERALLSAMAYVDLNSIRAGMANSLETSHYTSVQARLKNCIDTSEPVNRSSIAANRGELLRFTSATRPLTQFFNDKSTHLRNALPIRREDYLHLVQQTAYRLVGGKCENLNPKVRSILSTLSLSQIEWLRCATAFKENFRNGDLRLNTSA